MSQRMRTAAGLVLALSLGCAELPVLPGLSRDVTSEQDTATHRYQFQTERDPAALTWLLVNCIQNGQSVAEVNRMLGETGEREYADRELKTTGDGHYLDSDIAYRWGPDANSRTIVLFFRDGKLVNFDPSELPR
jgi:hypothetical protein